MNCWSNIGKMSAITGQILKHSRLLLPSLNFLQPCRTKVIVSHSDKFFRMGRLKRKYLQRAPIIITKEDGSVSIEGVSDKKTPSVVDYKTPEYLFRGNPGPDGSGDLGIFPEPDLSRPRKEFAGLKAYEDASPEVKDVLSLRFAKRRDQIEVVREDYRYTYQMSKQLLDNYLVKNLKMSRFLDRNSNVSFLQNDGG